MNGAPKSRISIHVGSVGLINDCTDHISCDVAIHKVVFVGEPENRLFTAEKPRCRGPRNRPGHAAQFPCHQSVVLRSPQQGCVGAGSETQSAWSHFRSDFEIH